MLEGIIQRGSVDTPTNVVFFFPEKHITSIALVYILHIIYVHMHAYMHSCTHIHTHDIFDHIHMFLL